MPIKLLEICRRVAWQKGNKVKLQRGDKASLREVVRILQSIDNKELLNISGNALRKVKEDMYYKLTDQDLQTYKGFQWEIGKWVKAKGEGGLCTNGCLHCYGSPLLAVLLNPIHIKIKDPKLFEVEVRGKEDTDGLKYGVSEMRLIREIPLPEITTTQKVAFGILCAKEVCKDKDWNIKAQTFLVFAAAKRICSAESKEEIKGIFSEA